MSYKRGYMYAPEPNEEGPGGGWLAILWRLAVALLGFAILVGTIALGLAIFASDEEPTAPDKPEKQIVRYDPWGDNNHDGHIDENEDGWSCETMGDMKCGPNEHRMRLS